MRNMKKIASLIMTVIMVFAMMTTAWADEVETGSITIEEKTLVESAKYSVYRILDLGAYDKANNIYSYTASAKWKDFLKTEDAKAYLSVENGAVYGKESFTEANAPQLAEKAIAWAKANSIAADGVMENGTISGLPLGYYLVDSSAGVLCGLTTTNPDVTIHEKNTVPEVKKEIQIDAAEGWKPSNSANIGDTVNYKVTIIGSADVEKYVCHDKMTDGLTFTGINKIEHKSEANTEELDLNTDYTVSTNPEDKCTFEVTFTEDFCATVKNADEITIYYAAVLNENAVVASEKNTNEGTTNEANTNEVKLYYGDNCYTEVAKTNTYTYQFYLVKTDGEGNFIDGAEFKLYDAASGGTEIPVVLDTEALDDNPAVYRHAKTGETGTSIIVSDGAVIVKGLASGTYYLEETVAPKGYNRLTARKEVKIESANLDATIANGVWVEGGVQVVNNAGTLLPTTGGMGTTLLYLAGGALVLLALVLLITKKRMGNAE